jgi:hypothetical protein
VSTLDNLTCFFAESYQATQALSTKLSPEDFTVVSDLTSYIAHRATLLLLPDCIHMEDVEAAFLEAQRRVRLTG